MKLYELLSDIEDIVDTASTVPLTSKIIVDPEELLDIVKDIRDSFPEEVHEAQWIQKEKDKILSDVKKEQETMISDAKRKAEDLIEKDEILVRSTKAAEELMKETELNIKEMKMKTYDYMDGILFNFREKLDHMSSVFLNEMFNDMENNFNKVNDMLDKNREEIKEMAYRTQMGQDGTEVIKNEEDEEE